VKNNPSSVEFRFNTNRLEAHVHVPINPEESELVQYLDLPDPNEALAKQGYSVMWQLDILFPEMREFWDTALLSYRQSESRFAARSASPAGHEKGDS
jgi:hypothetical protein